MEVVDILHPRRLHHLEGWKSAEEDRQDGVKFEPRERCADAEKYSGAEGKVGGLLAVRLEDERV